MQRFLARRLVLAIITLLAVSVIVFAMARIAGDPRTVMLGDFTTRQQYERVGERLGLDKPYYEQYWIFLKGAVRGDFGTSTATTTAVTELILERLAATLQLAGVAFLFSIIAGVGIMLIFFFAVWLKWVPPSGREEWNSIFLPAISLGWFFVAANMRLVRSAMLDALDSEYIKLAKAKGVGSTGVIWKHALRNALIPPLTLAGVTLGNLVTGSIAIELVFAWPGLGQLSINSTLQSDYPVLQAVVLVFTLLYLAAAFLVDVLYAFIDPRIRYT